MGLRAELGRPAHSSVSGNPGDGAKIELPLHKTPSAGLQAAGCLPVVKLPVASLRLEASVCKSPAETYPEWGVVLGRQHDVDDVEVRQRPVVVAAHVTWINSMTSGR